MAELGFSCINARADRYAAGPTLTFNLRVDESTGERVHAIALQCQFRIEPQKRRYSDAEAARVNDLFGDMSRWADTLKPFQFAHVAVMVPSFDDSIEIDVPVPCTYDLDIAVASYFQALDSGDIPFLILFSGTLITQGQTGFSVTRVPWHKETSYRLPIIEWRAMMDRFFPDSGWLRLSRDTLRRLGEFKNARALPTWEQTLTALLDAVALDAVALGAARPAEAPKPLEQLP